MRYELLKQVIEDAFAPPTITLAMVADAVRNLYRNDPVKAERSVGNMYGHAFKKAEAAYAARGSRGRQEWTR